LDGRPRDLQLGWRDLKTLTLILAEGPYVYEYTEIAYKIAKAALKHYYVKVFIYLDAILHTQG
jgi:sulfur relay (sulfurtransferase) complex TusBCD TusD component (DsrE family)